MSTLLEGQKKKSLEEERKRFNLQLLKRHDENINEIVAHSSFVSVYIMDDSGQKWTRGDIEGFLHIVKRDTEPIYQLIVLNQKNPENLVLGITNEWELSSETNFLFYKINNNNNSRVSCLWFYEIEERKSIEITLKQIISKLMVNNLNNDILNSSSSSKNHLSESTTFYNSDAGKTILGFLNKNNSFKDNNNIESNNEKVVKKPNNISEKKNNCDSTIVNNSLKKLLHFQGILGKSNELDGNNNFQKRNNITSEAITNIIMDVLSSKQVYDMINERIELLLRK